MPFKDIAEIKSYLKKDEISNLNILGVIENYSINHFIQKGNSVSVKAKTDETWNYFGCKDKNEFVELLDLIEETPKYLGALDEWMLPIIKSKFKIDWQLSARQIYLPDNLTLPQNSVKIIPLKVDDSEFIMSQSNYKSILSTEYLNFRISNSFSAAIYENDKLAAWGLTHDDGGIGALHVVDNYRRKGYGKEIVIYLSEKIRSSNRIPYAQVEEKNVNAMNLFAKLGFVKDKMVTWLKCN